MDISKYVTIGEDGKVKIDEKAFQSEFDSEIHKAVETNKNGKLKDEIRKELEEEAKLSAEEKLKKEKEEFEAFKKQSMVELNQTKAKAKLEGKGFSDKEIEFILKTVSDEDDSLSTLDDLITERGTLIEKNKKEALESLQQQQENAGSKIDPNTKFNPKDNEEVEYNISREDIASIYEK